MYFIVNINLQFCQLLTMVIDTDFTKMCVILKFDIINVISYKNIKTVPYFIEYGILISPENTKVLYILISFMILAKKIFIHTNVFVFMITGMCFLSKCFWETSWVENVTVFLGFHSSFDQLERSWDAFFLCDWNHFCYFYLSNNGLFFLQ